GGCPRRGCAAWLRSRSLPVLVDPVHLDALVGQPGHRAGDVVLRAIHLQDHPAETLLDAGPPNVGDHAELVSQPVDHGFLDQVLREGQVEPDPAHAGPASSGGFMLPERKPSRSTVTYRYPRSLRAATT